MMQAGAWRAGLAGLLLCGCSSESLVGLSASKAPTNIQPIDELSEPCARLPRLAAPASIDGSPDLPSAPLLELPRDTWREPANPMPAEMGAEYLIAWSPEGLYFYVSVRAPEVRPSTSATLWCGDAVHLFADNDGQYARAPEYDAVGTRQFIVTAPVATNVNTTRASVYGDATVAPGAWSSTRFGAFPSGAGYSVEGVVTPRDLGGVSPDLVLGATVGWSLAVSFSGVRAVPNPGDPVCEGLRLGDIAVALGEGACVSPHCNVDAFCSPVLAE